MDTSWPSPAMIERGRSLRCITCLPTSPVDSGDRKIIRFKGLVIMADITNRLVVISIHSLLSSTI